MLVRLLRVGVTAVASLVLVAAGLAVFAGLAWAGAGVLRVFGYGSGETRSVVVAGEVAGADDYELGPIACEVHGRRLIAIGDIENTRADAQRFRLTVRFDDAGGDLPMRLVNTALLEPGDRRLWQATAQRPGAGISGDPHCRVDVVRLAHQTEVRVYSD